MEAKKRPPSPRRGLIKNTSDNGNPNRLAWTPDVPDPVVVGATRSYSSSDVSSDRLSSDSPSSPASTNFVVFNMSEYCGNRSEKATDKTPFVVGVIDSIFRRDPEIFLAIRQCLSRFRSDA